MPFLTHEQWIEQERSRLQALCWQLVTLGLWPRVEFQVAMPPGTKPLYLEVTPLPADYSKE